MSAVTIHPQPTKPPSMLAKAYPTMAQQRPHPGHPLIIAVILFTKSDISIY